MKGGFSFIRGKREKLTKKFTPPLCNGFPMDSFKMRLNDFSFVVKEIKDSSIYLNASNNEKSMILSGKQFFKSKRVDIFSQDLESAIFNMLSNSVHSFYIGLSNNSIKTPSVFASFIDPLMLCIVSIETTLIYTANILVLGT